MTESRGAMTAQQFMRSPLYKRQTSFLDLEEIHRFADALSAHNTAHWKERAEAAERAIDKARRLTASDPRNTWCRQATIILDSALTGNEGKP